MVTFTVSTTLSCCVVSKLWVLTRFRPALLHYVSTQPKNRVCTGNYLGSRAAVYQWLLMTDDRCEVVYDVNSFYVGADGHHNQNLHNLSLFCWLVGSGDHFCWDAGLFHVMYLYNTYCGVCIVCVTTSSISCMIKYLIEVRRKVNSNYVVSVFFVLVGKYHIICTCQIHQGIITTLARDNDTVSAINVLTQVQYC